MLINNPAAFETRALAKSYRQGSATVRVLDGIDIRIDAGQFVVIAGPSGSGKSTLLNLLAGLDRPDEGTVLVSGQDLAALSDDALSQLRRRQFGFVFQSFNLVPVLSAYENVEYGLWLNGVPRAERDRRVMAALGAVGLSARTRQRPDHLSGGERQRVALARALVHGPTAMLADEPTASLDARTASEVVSILVDLNERSGTTLVLATHDASIIARAKRVIRLVDGRVYDAASVT